MPQESNNKMKNNAGYAREFDPDASVFVSANAGAGKTSLLTNRVLSLLLNGVAPAKILCLTFTNAAAAEMSQRILKSLGKWVMADDETLRAQVSKLVGDNPSAATLTRARALFAEVLEAPQGVNIQTIHGFSQSLLRRFPLEAGVSPHFSVMDGRSEQEAMGEARLRLFNHAKNHDANLRKSLENLAGKMAEGSFYDLLYEIVGNKRKFSHIFQQYGGAIGVQNIIAKKMTLTKSS